MDDVGLSRADIESLASVGGAAKFCNTLLVQTARKLAALPLEEYRAICEQDLEDPDTPSEVVEAVKAMIDILNQCIEMRDSLKGFGLRMRAAVEAREKRMREQV
jgi:hypothetical protein